jgi:putative peptidoglycan lipid II flippase
VSRRSLVRTTLLLLPFQIVFRAGEALLPLLLAAWFGRSTATDVYYFAWAVFTLAGSLLFTAFQDSAIVPILAEVRLRAPKEMPVVTGALLGHTLFLGAGLSLVMGALAAGYFAIRYDGVDESLAVRMAIPFSLLLLAQSVRAFLSALLNSSHRYFALPVASSVGMATALGVIALGRGALGVLVVPIGSLLGELVAVSVLAVVAFRFAKMKLTLSLARPEPVRRFARLIASEIGGSAVTRINPVVDQLMAGLAGVIGGGTLLRYSGDVASLPTSLLQATLLPVLLSHLSEDFATRDTARVQRTVGRALVTVTFVLAALGLGIFLFREPLLRFVFLRGEMDEAGVARMAKLLPYHLLGLAPFGALLVLARTHVALQNGRIMFSMGLLNAGANVLFNVVFLRTLGLEGLALSTSLVQLFVAVVFWWRLQPRLRSATRGAVPREADA